MIFMADTERELQEHTQIASKETYKKWLNIKYKNNEWTDVG